jgi:diguanylate cyclase (GGDEF)-like protein/PAS domain S-box-containing protein
MSDERRDRNVILSLVAPAFSTTVGVRISGLVCLALAAFFIPRIPNGQLVALVLVASAALALVLSLILPAKAVDVVGMVQDHLAAFFVALVAPSLWPTCVVAAVANTTWSTVHADSRYQRPLAQIAPAALIAIGVVRQPEGWLPIAIVAAVLSLLFGLLSSRVQSARLDQELDLAQALSTSGAIVHVSDLLGGDVDTVTGPIQEITGWTAEEWMRLDHRELLHPDDLTSFWLNLSDLEDDQIIERKGRFRRPDGTYTWIRDVSRVVRMSGGRWKLRGISMDVTEIEHAHHVIRQQAETDQLTGLANRAVLISELERHLERDEPVALALLDLDQFKNINDTLGHGFGDSVLVEVGRRLDHLGRAADSVVRLGGDEFAIIVPGLDDDAAAERLAVDIAEACTRVISLQGMTISSGVSIGIALAPRDGDTVQTLLRHADIAMYAAKRDRRSFQIFTPSIQQAPLEDLVLGASLSRALDEDEFLLHFQPKVQLETGRVIGFEGLARWQHRELGLLQPDRFINLITLGNFDRAFTDRVLDLGTAFSRRCADAGYPMPISVNISARSLFDDTFPDRVEATLARHQVGADQLIIEITEHDIMHQASESDVLDRLYDLGIALSVDDFGTGHSSMARLVDLPVNEIKVDRRFIAHMLSSQRDAVIVRSIVDLGKNLDLSVVAEGLERIDEVAAVRGFGCQQGQGFLFSRPVAPADALELVTTTFPVCNGQPQPTPQSMTMESSPSSAAG